MVGDSGAKRWVGLAAALSVEVHDGRAGGRGMRRFEHVVYEKLNQAIDYLAAAHNSVLMGSPLAS